MKRLGARWEMCWLLFLTRGVCQANRVLLGALMPYLSEEVRMSSQEKGSILAAFSTGYMLTQVIGGAASDAFGGKILTSIAITSMSLGSLVAAPLLKAGGLHLFWFCYFFMGLAEGPSYPTTGSIMSKWVPAHERGAALSIVDTGSSVASMVTFAVAPLLAARYGWRFAFHCFGSVSFAICALWMHFSANRPAESVRVSPEERALLVQGGVPPEDVLSEDVAQSDVVVALLNGQDDAPPNESPLMTPSAASETSQKLKENGGTSSASSSNGGTASSNGHHLLKKTTPTPTSAKVFSYDDVTAKKVKKRKKAQGFPFRLFCFSGAWAVVLAHAAFNFGRYFVYNSIVSFYVDVAGVSPVTAGTQVLFGQIADTLGKFLFAGAVDRAIQRDASKKTRVRKIVSSTAFVVFALSMLTMAHTTSVAAITCALIIAKIASSAHVCGFKTTYLDLSSKHTGSLTGVSNTLATLSAMISPLATGYFLGRHNTADGAANPGWRHMFFLIVVVNLLAALVWALFASADSLDDKIATSKGAA
mmetsp:Transcript_24282/g.74936  ORF Transcript_24282/g.74936 Transcript_24282/m.74936 type:complete len:532 (+) Transcript_24282:64-1659(+)